jgi:hypothetical protein
MEYKRGWNKWANGSKHESRWVQGSKLVMYGGCSQSGAEEKHQGISFKEDPVRRP